jgi:hypothetical protein
MQYEEIEKEIKLALSKLEYASKVEALRNLAISWSKNGMKKVEILRIFSEYHKVAQEQSKEEEGNALGDVLDMLTGYYTGQNLEIID